MKLQNQNESQIPLFKCFHLDSTHYSLNIRGNLFPPISLYFVYRQGFKYVAQAGLAPVSKSTSINPQLVNFKNFLIVYLSTQTEKRINNKKDITELKSMSLMVRFIKKKFEVYFILVKYILRHFSKVGELTHGLCNLSISDTLGLTGDSTHYGSFPENPSQFGLEQV